MRYFIAFVLFSISLFSSFAQSKQFVVGFLLDKTNVDIVLLLDELENEIKSVVGEDATINFSKSNRLINDFSIEKARSNYESFITGNVDIIIAFGIVNNSAISKLGSYSKPTIVFGALSEELLENSTIISNVTNYTTITTSQSYTEDLKLLKELAKPSKVG